MSFGLNKYKIVTSATICLHNFLITRKLNETDMQFNQIPQVPNDQEIQGPRNGVEQRNCLTQYFVSRYGSVPWQLQYI